MAIQSNFPAIKPSLLLDFANTKSLDPRITFTRASTATYYDGVTTAMAEQNLLLNSQAINGTGWNTFNSSVTINSTTAPDGTSTAGTITENTATNQHQLYQAVSVISGNSYTWSGYFKDNGRSIFQLFCYATTTVYIVEFDLTAVTTTNRTGTGTATITSVGNGWYRITATATATATGTGFWQLGLCSAANTPSYTGNGTSGVYVWGAQLEQRSAVTAYTATTTQAITNYIPKLQSAASGVARFDNNPTTGESLGLLIEEQRTNLVTYSEQFDNAAWTKSGTATITANSNVAPDGTISADQFYCGSTAASECRRTNLTVSSGSNTYSVYAKQGSAPYLIAQISDGTGSYARQWFDLSAGTVGTTGGVTLTIASASIQSVGNGWYRCVITVSLASGVSTAQVNNFIGTSNGGFGGTATSFIYIWGAQLEAGAFATSYIPTVASQVTRSADAASMTGTNFSSWYAADQGTLYCELGSLLSTSTTQVPGFNMGDSNNRIELRPVGNSIGHARCVVQVNGSGQVDISITTLASTAARRVGMVYKVNDFYITGNGLSSGASSSSGTLPVVSQALIGTAPYDSNTKTNGTIKKIAYYPLRVTNAQLQAITS